VSFRDAEGIKPGETPIQHRGVLIGQVIDVSLSKDERNALVKIRMNRDAESFADGGAMFWVVRPEASVSGVTGLSTVFSGPYIDAMPGEGPRLKEFTGLDSAPVFSAEGLSVVLRANRLEHLTDQ